MPLAPLGGGHLRGQFGDTATRNTGWQAAADAFANSGRIKYAADFMGAEDLRRTRRCLLRILRLDGTYIHCGQSTYTAQMGRSGFQSRTSFGQNLSRNPSERYGAYLSGAYAVPTAAGVRLFHYEPEQLRQGQPLDPRFCQQHWTQPSSRSPDDRAVAGARATAEGCRTKARTPPAEHPH